MTAYRYWRVSSIKARIDPFFMGIAELKFFDASGVNLSTDPKKSFGQSYYQSPSPQNNIEKAFDGNPNTWTERQVGNNNDWYIGYDFGLPVDIHKIGVAGRNDLAVGFGREWQSAAVEVSSDGNTWIYYGLIEPRIAAENSSLVISPIITNDSLNIFAYKGLVILDIYSTSANRGSFSGVVTQGKSGEPKLPLKAEVLLYDRMTNKLMQRTWSNNLGAYSFDGVDTGREYYTVAIHPNRTYNAVIQDGLKSGMTA